MQAINKARKILDDLNNNISSNMASKRFGLALAESYLKLAQLEHITGIDTTRTESRNRIKENLGAEMTQVITDWNARATEILAMQTIQPVILEVTLEQLKAKDACVGGFKKLLTHVGHNYNQQKPINLLTILESNGLDDAIWAFQAVADADTANRVARLFACDCAEMVLPIFEAEDLNDSRPRDCIAVSRAFAVGEASSEQLAAAWDAAWDAARAAAWAAARAAARAAAWDAARAAACQLFTARLTNSERT